MLAVKLLFWLKLGPSLSRVPATHVLPAGVPGGHAVVNAPVGVGVPGRRAYVCCSPLGPHWVGVPPTVTPGILASFKQSAASPGLASYWEINLWPCVPT